MTQSPKTSRPKRKEKLSDKEQSERFIEAASDLIKTSDAEAFDVSIMKILRQKDVSQT